MKDAAIKDLLARLVLATNVASDGALSGVLGVSSQAVYDAKKREKIPDSWIRIVAEKCNISADWLFFGRGSMHPGEASPSCASPDVAPTAGAATPCAQCAKLQTELELERTERRELSTENRALSGENRLWAAKAEQLLHENGALRERCATLAERLKIYCPDGDFSKAQIPQSSEAHAKG